MMQRSVPAICIVLCSLLANACSNDISRTTVATVLSVKGRVVSGSGERDRFVPVTIESSIHQGDRVQSSEGASVDLQLVPGALARLAGDSEMTIEELKIVKDGNETAGGMRNRTARVRLNRGKIVLLFSQPNTSELQVAVTAHGVTVTPDSDCLFSVWTDGASTRVTCARNTVNAFAASLAPVAIAAGYFQRWPTAGPKPLAADQNAAAQIDIRESVEAAERLLDQAASLQNRCPL
jgi:hypothetical protein